MIAEETPPRTAPAARALDPIFSPRSVAVIGASRRRDSIGFALLHNLVTPASGWTGSAARETIRPERCPKERGGFGC